MSPADPAGHEHETSTRGGTPGPRGSTPAVDDHPEWIGPYRILQTLGEGGMGVVYVAEQRQPVTRRVALKIIKGGLDTKEVVARFEAERQALAVMDHPGIAKVFDGAVAENGRPYFVMELVHGVPITDYCDSNRLTTRHRVELFIGVCNAVQHAHQKGVIHRDLKPSNVLVSLQDGQPVPKVIDFGIAKATERRLSENTLVTQIGQVLGTPAFMSPEQYGVTGLDVDTRTDIYSLGVMLYVLLAGAFPFDPKALARTGAEGHWILRGTDPATPSSRLRTLGDEKTRIAEHRHTDPGSLKRQIEGDLDWITLKAMARDRTDRYETANALAMDLKRHLNAEPVVARPPSTRYRLGRFVTRHRTAVAFAAVIAVLVVGSAITAVVQAGRIARERDRAEREMGKATALNTFLQEILSSADPTRSGRQDVTVLQALEDSSRKIDSAFGGQPLLAAAARRTIARTYTSLGRYADAERLLRSALDVEKATLGAEHEEVAESLASLATLFLRQARYEDAEQAARASLAIREKRFSPEDPHVAEGLTLLAEVLFDRGKYDEGEATVTKALAIKRRALGDKNREVATTLELAGNIAGIGKGDFKRAAPLIEESLAIRREVLGPNHPDTALSLNDLAVVRLGLDDFAGAERLYKESLDVTKRAYGDEHPEVAVVIENIGGVYYRTNRFKESLAQLDQALAMRRKILGDSHTAVTRTLLNKGTVATAAGDLAAAETAFSESLPRFRRELGDDHPDVATALLNWARATWKRNDWVRTERLCREALAIRLRGQGKSHPGVGEAQVALGRALVGQRRFEEAEPLLVEGRKMREAQGAADRWVVIADEELAKVKSAQR